MTDTAPPSPPSLTAKDIGLAIRTTRQLFRLKQKTVWQRAGVSQGLYSEIETGRKAPSLETLDQIAIALDMSPGALLLLAEHLAGRNSDEPLRHLENIKTWLAQAPQFPA